MTINDTDINSFLDRKIPQRTNVFAGTFAKVWKHRYEAELLVTDLTGGIPSDQRVAEGWLRTKLHNKDIALEVALAETMAERGISRDDAVDEMVESTNVNGFKRDGGVLVLEGRCIKAAIKEAFNVGQAGGHFEAKKWGTTHKGLLGFVAEHIVVPERYVPILHEDGSPFTEATGVNQKFVHTWRGSAPAYEEYCDPAVLRFHVLSDWDFEPQWPTVWTIGNFQGIGATRSQGRGSYIVTHWAKA